MYGITNSEAFLAGLACSFLLLSAYVVIDGAMHYKRPIPREATWTLPEIPQCDRELWERIVDGCTLQMETTK